MSRRARISAWVLGAALLVGAVIVLRVDSTDQAAPRPVPFPRFAAESIVLPQPPGSVPSPGPVRVFPGPGRLRLAWADGLPGGQAPAGVSGYEVRWLGQVRLIAEPAVQLDGLDQREYQVQVRSIGPFGQRSEPVRVAGSPAASLAISGQEVDNFDNADSVRPDVLGSRWHVSGYRGCVDLASGAGAKQGQLTIQLSCGADDVVLRSRAALQLGSGTERGRVTVVTDGAGPHGELTFDFVPGPADRVGALGDGDQPLPAGAIRVSISDAGVRVSTDQGPLPAIAGLPRRGSGVLHRFDVALTSSGLQVFQDDSLVGTAPVRPTWDTATVLLGITGPHGRQTLVHVDLAALSAVVPRPEQVVEVSAILGTQRVLKPQEEAPGIGVSREPLLGAASARLRATAMLGEGADPTALALQVSDRTIPLRPATPGPPSRPGAYVTLVADLPPELLTGSAPLSPLVIRGPGTATMVESYLEVTPGPGGWQASRPPEPELTSRMPALPTASVRILDTATVTAPFKMEIILDGGLVQRDADELAPVRGFEVFLNDRMIASIPTDLGGPAVGGSYVLTVSLPGQLPGAQKLDIRVHPTDQKRPPQSTLVDVSLVS